MKRLPVNLKDHQHEVLRKIAFDDNKSISYHIRKAIDEYLKNPRKRRDEMPYLNLTVEQWNIIIQALEEKQEIEIVHSIAEQLKEAEYDQVSGVRLDK